MVEKYESKNSGNCLNAPDVKQMDRDYRNLKFFSNIIKVKERTLENNLTALTKSNAIIEFDLTGKILNVNELFLDLLGYKEDEVIGKHHSIFLDHSSTNLQEYEVFWQNLRNGQFQQDEFRRVRKDGSTVWLRGNYNPILNADDVPETVLKIATDITLTKKQQIEIDAITTAIYKSNLTIEFDLDGRILKANDSFLQTMEYSFDEVQGQHHSMFLEKGTNIDPKYVAFWEKLRQGQYESGDYMRLTKTGKTVWIKGNYNPIFDTQGKPYKVIKIATDITQTKQQQFELTEVNKKLHSHSEDLKLQHQKLQQINHELKLKSEALEQKNKEVEAALLLVDQKTTQLQISNKYKSEFLANMSHELRTPLNSLLILSQDLAENKAKNLTHEQVESAEIIYRSGTDLLELINEVLDLSKIEAGKMTLNAFKISLADLIKDIHSDFKHQAEKKQLEFQISVDTNVPSHIVTDRQRLNQVLRNIISNAIKFTSTGAVTVNISSVDKKILFKIADTGIGITLSEQSSVFEPFHQADSGTSRKYGGTGLGLSISRDLVKLLNGQISLESKPNQGSTFTIAIPYTISNDIAANHEIEQLSNDEKPNSEDSSNKNISIAPLFKSQTSNISDLKMQSLVGKNIAVVDDDMRNMFALSKILRSKGMNVIKCESGKIAINVMKSDTNVDLVLMDIMMPEMNGYETIAKIKELPNRKLMPIITLTAKATKEDELKCLNAGANGYLTKPLNISKLLKLMCEVLN